LVIDKVIATICRLTFFWPALYRHAQNKQINTTAASYLAWSIPRVLSIISIALGGGIPSNTNKLRNLK